MQTPKKVTTMHPGHYIEYYDDCGHIGKTCRCAAPSKTVKHLAGRCPKCSQKPSNTALDEHFFTLPWGTQS